MAHFDEVYLKSCDDHAVNVIPTCLENCEHDAVRLCIGFNADNPNNVAKVVHLFRERFDHITVILADVCSGYAPLIGFAADRLWFDDLKPLLGQLPIQNDIQRAQMLRTMDELGVAENLWAGTVYDLMADRTEPEIWDFDKAAYYFNHINVLANSGYSETFQRAARGTSFPISRGFSEPRVVHPHLVGFDQAAQA